MKLKSNLLDTASNSQYAGVYNFLTYITDQLLKKKTTEIKNEF